MEMWGVDQVTFWEQNQTRLRRVLMMDTSSFGTKKRVGLMEFGRVMGQL